MNLVIERLLLTTSSMLVLTVIAPPAFCLDGNTPTLKTNRRCGLTRSVPKRAGKIVMLTTQELEERVVKRVAALHDFHIRTKGVVVVEVLVDKRGEVMSAIAVEGHPLLQKRAINAISQWRFEPLKIKGAPVFMCGRLSIDVPPKDESGPQSL